MRDGNLLPTTFFVTSLSGLAGAGATQLGQVGSTNVPAFIAPCAGYLVALCVDLQAKLGDNGTRDTAVFIPTINGVAITGEAANELTVTLNSQAAGGDQNKMARTVQKHSSDQVGKGGYAFLPGDLIGVQVTVGSHINAGGDCVTNLIVSADVVTTTP